MKTRHGILISGDGGRIPVESHCYRTGYRLIIFPAEDNLPDVIVGDIKDNAAKQVVKAHGEALRTPDGDKCPFTPGVLPASLYIGKQDIGRLARTSVGAVVRINTPEEKIGRSFHGARHDIDIATERGDGGRLGILRYKKAPWTEEDP